MSPLADLGWYERARAIGARVARAAHRPGVRLDGLSYQQLGALGVQHGSGDDAPAADAQASTVPASPTPHRSGHAASADPHPRHKSRRKQPPRSTRHALVVCALGQGRHACGPQAAVTGLRGLPTLTKCLKGQVGRLCLVL